MLRGTDKVITAENMRFDEEKGKTTEQPSPDSEPLINGSDKKEEKVTATASTGISVTGLKVLALLAVQNCSKNLIMRAAVKDKPDFLYSAAVIGSELTKFTLSTLWILCYERGSVQSIITFLKQDWWNMVLLMVPAGVYNLQQTLEYVALSNLDAALFSVLVQTKLCTTAIFSVLLLRRKMRKAQVVSLVLLTVGVMLANLRGGGSGAASNLTGILATLGISTLSGFAAVYTEKVIKSQRVERSKEYGLAYMQVQLASASLIIIGLWAIIADFEKIMTNGLWHNFNGTAMLSVFNSALGGLTVAAVLKFADSVLKGYATAISVMLTGILSMFFFGTELSFEYMLGMVNVVCSVILYNAKDLDVNLC